jgi:hypothetical protein
MEAFDLSVAALIGMCGGHWEPGLGVKYLEISNYPIISKIFGYDNFNHSIQD